MKNNIYILINSECNLNCIFCSDLLSRNIKKKYTNIYQQIEDWFINWEENTIFFSWWEPLLDIHLLNYISFAKKKWYWRIWIVTNFSFINIINKVKIIYEAWLTDIVISFHSISLWINNYLSWINVDYNIRKNIILLKSKNFSLNIAINVVVNSLNLPYLERTISFLLNVWVNNIYLLNLVPSVWMDKKLINKLLISYDNSCILKKIIFKYKNNLKVNFDKFNPNYFIYKWDILQKSKNFFNDIDRDLDNLLRLSFDKNTKMFCYWIHCNKCPYSLYCNYIDKLIKSWDDFNYIILNSLEDVKNIENNSLIIFSSIFFNKILNEWSYLRIFSIIDNLSFSNLKVLWVPYCIYVFNINAINYNINSFWWTYDEFKTFYAKYLNSTKISLCKSCTYFDDCKWLHVDILKEWYKLILKNYCYDKKKFKKQKY